MSIARDDSAYHSLEDDRRAKASMIDSLMKTSMVKRGHGIQSLLDTAEGALEIAEKMDLGDEKDAELQVITTRLTTIQSKILSMNERACLRLAESSLCTACKRRVRDHRPDACGHGLVCADCHRDNFCPLCERGDYDKSVHGDLDEGSEDPAVALYV